MDGGSLYDPPPTRTSLSRSRGRASSFSASTAPSPGVFASSTRSRRQSVSSLPTYDAATKPMDNLSDEEAPLVDLWKPSPALSGPSRQDPLDAVADKKLWRDGRQSKAQMEQEYGAQHNTADFEKFLAQLYALTHAIDALENDVEEIVELRNQIVRIDPKVDVGQVSLRADLDTLAALTTKTGKGIVGLETWLGALQQWGQQVRELVKAGQAGESKKEIGEIKYHLSSAQLDFEDAMERIREGAFKEKERRQRTRIWMARHIRAREPDIDDKDIKGLLKAAELGSADGVAASHVTSYAGLFALQNPFTELAELTNAKHALRDSLDREVVDAVTGKTARNARKVINLNAPTSSKKSKSKSKSSKKQATPSRSVPASTTVWGSRLGFLSGIRPQYSDDPYDRKMRYIQQEQYAAEKDLEYGFARQQQQERVNRRKKLVIALLLVIIAALILFVVLATMRIPDQTVTWASAAYPSMPTVAQFPTAIASTAPAGDPSASDAASTLVAHASSLSASLSSAGASLASTVSAAISSATATSDNGLHSIASHATHVVTMVTAQGASAVSAVTQAVQSAKNTQPSQATVWWTPASA